MSRELKFRAWDKKRKKMFHFEIDDTISVGYLEIMQFTGFTDKNGKNIFEGDVVSDKFKVNGELIVSKQQVFWNEISGNWSLDYSFHQNKSACCALHEDLKKYKYEVIGNIYENPELLKPKK